MNMMMVTKTIIITARNDIPAIKDDSLQLSINSSICKSAVLHSIPEYSDSQPWSHLPVVLLHVPLFRQWPLQLWIQLVRMFLYHILSHRVSQYIPVNSRGHICQWICCISRHSYSVQYSSEHSQHHRFLVDILYDKQTTSYL